jgi:hypothetical protein
MWKAGRLRDLYEWSHITKEECLAEHDAVQRELQQLSGEVEPLRHEEGGRYAVSPSPR